MHIDVPRNGHLLQKGFHLAGKAEALRTLGLLAQSSQITLYLDGTEVASFEDTDLTSGDVALWGRAGETVLRLLFDNMEIYELS